jgi:hypothetical protein
LPSARRERADPVEAITPPGEPGECRPRRRASYAVLSVEDDRESPLCGRRPVVDSCSEVGMAVRSAADGRSVGVHVQKTSPSLLDFLLLEEHTRIYPRIEFDELEPVGGRHATRHRTLRLSLASSNRSALGSLVRHHGSCCTDPPSDFARVNPHFSPRCKMPSPFVGGGGGFHVGIRAHFS